MADSQCRAEKKIQLCVTPKGKEVLEELWGHVSVTGAGLTGHPQSKFEISQTPTWIMAAIDYSTERENSRVHSDTTKRRGKGGKVLFFPK